MHHGKARSSIEMEVGHLLTWWDIAPNSSFSCKTSKISVYQRFFYGDPSIFKLARDFGNNKIGWGDWQSMALLLNKGYFIKGFLCPSLYKRDEQTIITTKFIMILEN